MSTKLADFNEVIDFTEWVAQRERDGSFAPPVCNSMLCTKGTLLMMVVGGPNQRQDYHVNQGEEIFYQIKGDMTLKLMECGTPRDQHIREGEIFILPGGIPHSPQRFENTIGVVVERARSQGELDALRYYVDSSNNAVLWERWFQCSDLGGGLPPLIREFMGSEERTTRVPTAPIGEPPMPIDTTTMVKAPVSLESCFAAIHPGDWPKELVFKEFSTNLVTNETTAPTLPIETTCWVWVLEGSATVNESIVLPAGHCVLLPELTAWHHNADQKMRALLVYTTVTIC